MNNFLMRLLLRFSTYASLTRLPTAQSLRSARLQLLVFFLLLSLGKAFAEECPGEIVPREYLIRVNAQVAMSSQRLSVFQALGVDEVAHNYLMVPGLMLIKSSAIDRFSADKFVADGTIEYIVPNCRWKAIGPIDSYVQPARPQSSRSGLVPNDSLFPSQWAHVDGSYDLDSLEAWKLTAGSSDIVIGVVDTGVGDAHSDLAANIWTNPFEIAANGVDDDGNGYIDDVYGINALNHSGLSLDDNGHGTLVAGILGAVGNNGIGVAGLNWRVSIMALKVIDASGTIDFANALKGFEYAIEMKKKGVNVVAVNNSWGGYSAAPSSPLVDAISALNDVQILVVAGAGNNSTNNDLSHFYPAGVDLPNVISVAAIDETGSLASFSNYGPTTVDVAAPGKNIATTMLPNSYGNAYGTSMATPFVAGLVGLIASRESSLSASQIKARVLDTVRVLPTLSGKILTSGVVNANNALLAGGVGGICDPGTVNESPENDTDGDGVSDEDEVTDGTNDRDPGSFRVHLTSPVFALWNGYLEMVNVLELVNIGSAKLSVDIALFSIDGSNCKQLSVSIPAGGQRDIVLNTILSFARDSYGLVRISYRVSELDGRVSFYKASASEALSQGSGDYDFAYSIPLVGPIRGNSGVSFNTFWPGTNPAETSNLVSNWVSIVNLADDSKAYTVTRYSVSGVELSSALYRVKSKSRMDIEGGHIVPGTNTVGSHLIKPTDANSPYLALITRFGHAAPQGNISSSYKFAFPLLAKAGNGETMVAPLTTTLGAQNWLEVVNTVGKTIEVDVSFYSGAGVLQEALTSTIKAHAQVHFNVNTRIGNNGVGFALVRSSAANSVIAQSMVYLLDQTSGSVSGMYGSQAGESVIIGAMGSYNLFLDMYNWLKIVNPEASPTTVAMTVKLPDGSSVVKNIALRARSSLDVGIHDSATYSTSANSYGLVALRFAAQSRIYAELLRVRVDPVSQKIDFALPTEVR